MDSTIWRVIFQLQPTNHRITDSFRLEKASKILESIHWPPLAKPTTDPCPPRATSTRGLSTSRAGECQCWWSSHQAWEKELLNQQADLAWPQSRPGDGDSSCKHALRSLQLWAVLRGWVLRVLCAVVAVTSSWGHRWPQQGTDGSSAAWGLRVHLARGSNLPSTAAVHICQVLWGSSTGNWWFRVVLCLADSSV